MKTRCLLLAVIAGVVCGGWAEGQTKAAPPKVMFWSWYEADDFRPMEKSGAGVAYRALSVEFDGRDDVWAAPREIPVRIPAKMYRMAVIRFDDRSDPGEKAAYSPRQRELAVKMIVEMAALAQPQGLQIDFDAPKSAWPFYRQLLSEVRARIAPDIFLSVTALVSWCTDSQSWMAGLPVDEIVPMVFDMGRPTNAVVTLLRGGDPFAFGGCRGSIGVETSLRGGIHEVEPRAGQRAYFFAEYDKWSPELAAGAQKAFR